MLIDRHNYQTFLPLLRPAKGSNERSGRIVNMSSSSGRIGFPFVGAYAASKHAVEGLSDSLRRELLIYGVDVIVIDIAHGHSIVMGRAIEAFKARFPDVELVAGARLIFNW